MKSFINKVFASSHALKFFSIAVLVSIIFFSCNKFLDADLDRSLIAEDLVFSNDITANSAITGIYSDIQEFSPLSGYYEGLNSLCGLSSNELDNHPHSPNLIQFEEHNISPINPTNELLWNYLFKVIYRANAIIKGIKSSSGMSLEAVAKLEGEARFVRAYAYFYLVNLYGGVPIVNGTDYRINSKVGRSSIQEVYTEIVSDLTKASSLLSESYIGGEKIRPNKAAAKAFLARVYLYLEDWDKAELYSTELIEGGNYLLNSDLDSIFLANSSEAIWQLQPIYPDYCTLEGNYFIISSTPNYHIVSQDLLNGFEDADYRKDNWIGVYTDFDASTYYYPFKYKVQYKSPNDPFAEYSTIFRLGEQYLIRAEARAQKNKLQLSIEDIDVIRNRARLPLISNANPGIQKDDLLLAIEQERQVELFCEGGHRWLDLKRTGRAIDVLEDGITSEDLLYPVPQTELNRNSNFGEQNSGY